MISGNKWELIQMLDLDYSTRIKKDLKKFQYKKEGIKLLSAKKEIT
ncbi:hypothetical protein RHABOEDO_001654 [Candidatus Rhabdochlamydia oedothoracis]|uniref:Uncharacterized protein n=2 Tax=Candidatus Rhabdochlamydia TaxID=292833 RepID=A0ABX8V382_9BACT|nr:hypothetical protein RHABOEDO_001654 [Candidatus Rhabdochlamydia oedothoracis]